MESELRLSGFALILGASSGFGEATALELARRGMDVFGVHLDRRATLPNVERIAAAIRVFAMTSAGGHRIMPAYGAVSAAKAALESHVRQLAYELAPRRITANAICAGVTDTPALRKIPGNEKIIETALAHNPSKRLT